ncbi:hypothetical protein ACIQVC_01110 [Streptomyces sp. NPDC101112]|uniref:8-oxoguanine DNA glycosylase OGG fold protein n=1 Tax=Streptomyces sp. NPDC101112 TaxID=3366105 RepID=UPI00382BBA6F
MVGQGEMVERLRPLVVGHRGRRQESVRFRPSTWRPWLEPYHAAHVLGLGTADDASTGGDRLLGRDDLAAARRAAGDSPEGLRDLFVAVMIWGSGTTNGRAPRYTGAALGDPRLPGVLDTTRDAVRSGELGRAYAEFRVRGVGRSFFTKWFAAVDDRGPGHAYALILDDRVFRSLNALGWSSREAAGTRLRPARYVAYVTAMHDWAAALDVTADWLEWLMFDLNGRVRPPWGTPG